MSSPAFLLTLLILPVTCEGQSPSISLTGSASSAVTGHPFTFSCNAGLFSSWLRSITWIRQLKTDTREHLVACYDDKISEQSRISGFYNYTCTTNGLHTLTVPHVDFDTYQNSNWTCELQGFRSNRISLDVNVPLKRVTLFNLTRRVKRVREGETVAFECATNPTKPPSTITWMIGEDVVTEGVTIRSRDSNGLTTTVSGLTRTITPELHMKGIRCNGGYPAMNLNFTSKLIQLAVEGDMESSTKKLVVTRANVRELTFGAGVGVGMTVCLVPFLLAVAIFIALRTRQTVSAAENKPRTEATMHTKDTAALPCGAQPHNLYEGIDDSTRERSSNTSYEELRIYQNSKHRVA
ncbi:uncharacterized protein [Haliotis asinina]|uniref:uncharacterized protein isoform X2 n=1 Tax=Haliotis asinina TaxID=109174 RepID=UPI0035324366